MRPLPLNSPEAAARIVALVLIADGRVRRAEIDTLRDLRIERTLGLAPGRFVRVTQALCEDLLDGAYDAGERACSIGDATLAAMMAEVDDPGLRSTVLRLAVATAEADRHLARAEAVVMAAALQHWGMTAEAVASPLAAATV